MGPPSAASLQFVEHARAQLAVDGAPISSVLLLQVAARSFALRLGGRPREAMRFDRSLGLSRLATNALVDSSRGAVSFLAVQAGVTGMLAGDFHYALARFTEGLFTRPPDGLAFLHRDAHLKSALIHALFGNPETARSELAAARGVPRTQSWIEPGLDATERLADLVVTPGSDTGAALQELNRIPLHTLGEMWPFYVVTLHVLLTRARRADELRNQLERLAHAGLPGAGGDGLPASALPCARAVSALTRGDLAAARQFLRESDREFFLTRLIQARVELEAGMPERALEIALDVRTDTHGLRQVEVLRLGTVAAAHLALGDTGTTTDVLTRMTDIPGGPTEDDLARIPAEALRHAEQQVPGWGPSWGAVSLSEPQPPGIALTPRELDLLTCVARGHTREQTAAELMVSVNTVRTHQRSLYRKLGASDRMTLLREAYRRGLL